MSNEPIAESILASPAKINLHLRILGLREDGYHELRTLFYPVPGLFDTLRIEQAHDEHMYMRCPENPDLETPTNLIYKAWKAFGAATGFQPGLFVTLNKSIPMGGGLGGGSSNCATMLRWLNDNAGERAISHDELVALAAGLGADVPFFLSDHPAWAGGIGEELEPADVPLSGHHLLLVFPDIHVDTPWAYRAWDEANGSPKTDQFLTSGPLNTKNGSSVSPLTIVNDFEPVVFAKHPELGKVKETLIKNKATAAAMSGSGATLFGLFRDRDAAMSAADALKKNGLEIFLTDCE